jgi:hypothetical protein
MGRPVEYTAEEMREAIRNSGGVVAQAARELGCPPSTVYNYADRYKSVQTTLEEARLNHAAKAEAYHARLVEDREHPDHYKALMDVLRNYHPNDWSDRHEKQEHSHEEPRQIHVDLTPPEELPEGEEAKQIDNE